MKEKIAWFAVLCIVALAASNADACDATCQRVKELDSWKTDLFSGIDFMPRKYNPSAIWTFGDRAYPLLLGSSTHGAIIAVAGLGEGKVMALGTKAHVQKLGRKEKDETLAQFHLNIIHWVTNGASTNNRIVCQPVDSAQLVECIGDPLKRVLLWTGGDWPTVEDTLAVTDWVTRGNGLVHAFDKKKWQKSNKESVMKIGFYSTLLAAGMAYDPKIVKGSKNIYTEEDASNLVARNTIEMANQLTFESLENDFEVLYLLSQVERNPRYFPVDVANRLLAPFEPFAYAAEAQMIWPEGSLADPEAYVYLSTAHQAMYRLYHCLAVAHLWRPKAPNVHLFPGDIPDAHRPATESASFTFVSKVQTTYKSTGYYLLPGQEMTVTVDNEETEDAWTEFSILIGSHTDQLTDKNTLLRWPNVKRVVPLYDRQMTIRSMFGGLVTIKAPKGSGKVLKLTISGVVPTPYVNTEDPASIAAWKTSRNAPGLWADFRGSRIRFTIQSEGIRKLEEPWVMLEQWDDVVKKSYSLIDTPASKQREQWMTVDIQLGGGMMHSGYPLVGPLNKGDEKYDNFVLKQDFGAHQWGVYHELGHNLQSDASVWTWPGVKEVTCNIFALLHIERLGGQTEWPNEKLTGIISTRSFSKWFKDPSYHKLNNQQRLIVYSQLIRDFGWGCQTGVFHSYTQDKADATVQLPPVTDILGREQEWVLRWSRQVGYNLCPLFDFWHWPLTDDTRKALEILPAYFPDDSITQMAVALPQVTKILTAYPGVQRVVSSAPACPTFRL